MSTDPRIDHYIGALPEWQQLVCKEVRQLIHEAEPKIEETIKFANRPYFIFMGNVCALLAAKDHVNVFIYDPIAPDPEGVINQGQNNATARAVQIYEETKLNKPAFVQLIRAVIADQRAGGWRKVKAQNDQ